VAATSERETSWAVEFDEVESAPQEIPGTRALIDTVDAAVDEVIKLRQRRRLIEMPFTPGRLQLDDPDVTAGAWR
jgi:hypothetical protein